MLNEHKAKIDEILSEYKKDSVSFYRLSECAYVSDSNILVVGSSGSGKTKKIIIPNVENSNESLIIVDAFGDLVKECSGVLKNRGYSVRCVDFTNPATFKESNEDILHNLEILNLPKVKSAVFLKLSKEILNEQVLSKMNSFISLALKSLVRVVEANVNSNNMSANPYPVRFVFDNFDNTITFPEFYVAANTLKHLNIYFTIAIQSTLGIRKFYSDYYNTVLKSFKVVCFTGGNETNTVEYIAKISGYSVKDVLDLKKDSILIQIIGKEPIIDRKIS